MIAGLSYGSLIIWAYYAISTYRPHENFPPPMLVGVLGYDGHARLAWELYGCDAPYFGGWRYTADAVACVLLLIVSAWIHAWACRHRRFWLATGAIAVPLALMIAVSVVMGLHWFSRLDGVFLTGDVPLVHYGTLISWRSFPVRIFGSLLLLWCAVTACLGMTGRRGDTWLVGVRRSASCLTACLGLLAVASLVRIIHGRTAFPGLHSLWVVSGGAAIWMGCTLSAMLYHLAPERIQAPWASDCREAAPRLKSVWRLRQVSPLGRYFILATVPQLTAVSTLVTILIAFFSIAFRLPGTEYLIFGSTGTSGRGIEGPVIPFVTALIALLSIWTGLLACLLWYRKRWRYWNLHSIYCAHCWYDLRGSIQGGQKACPECGAPIPGEKLRVYSTSHHDAKDTSHA